MTHLIYFTIKLLYFINIITNETKIFILLPLNQISLANNRGDK